MFPGVTTLVNALKTIQDYTFFGCVDGSRNSLLAAARWRSASRLRFKGLDLEREPMVRKPVAQLGRYCGTVAENTIHCPCRHDQVWAKARAVRNQVSRQVVA